MSQVKTFGRYNLIRKVAQGGMAEIFLAKFQGIGGFEKKIIIKRILPRFSENREFIDMLIKEAKTAVLLHHQNIVQIYDLGKVRDTYFISMEYIRGKDLRTVLNRLKSQGQYLPRELAVFIAREICKGLDYAHNITDQHGEALSLVHRDISPPNILLSLEGEVKIIDFGIAKATSQATDTQAGVFKGKFAYMAPEQASGIPVDRRADIFATGLILWEMLTTRKLLEAESDIMTLERAKRIDGYDIPFREYDIPEQLENIIRKALKQDRSTRYQTAGEMSRDLTVYLNLNYPGFSETDLADFLRQLFNLDKRRGISGGEMITAAPGDRSNTNSEFFKSLAGPRQDNTDPSIKLAQARATAESSAPRPIKRESAAGQSDQWDLLEEIKAFAKGADEGGGGKPQEGGDGWVSQVAEDMVPQEDGTIITVPSNMGPGDPNAPATATTAPASNAPSHPASKEPAATAVPVQPPTIATATPVTPAPPAPGLGSRLMVPAFVLVLLIIGVGLLFPERVQQLRENLGLVPKATISFAYQPPDAEVLLNGQAVADVSSPYTLTLPIGTRHSLVVKKAGYMQEQVDIDLVASRSHSNINVVLKPELAKGNGKLELLGLPSSARIFINDAPVTAAGLQALPTDVSLKVQVEKEGYVTFEKTLPALGDAPASVEVAMKPAPVSISIETTPPNAIIMVDRRQVGTSPYKGDGYEPGVEYSIDVMAAGYKSHSTKIRPEIGKSLTLNIPLESTRPDAGKPGANTGTGTAVKPPVQTATNTQTAQNVPAPAPTPVPHPPDPGPNKVPEPPKANRNSVNVRVIAVPWADVYIDGKYLGRSPIELGVTPGKHKIRLVNRDREVDHSEDYDFQPSDDDATQILKFELN